MKCYGVSDRGLVREQNQDSFFISSNDHQDLMAVICDGIGGGAAGDVASSMAVTYMQKAFEKAPSFQNDGEVKRWLSDVIHGANDTIFMQSAKSKTQKGMGTTMVGTLILKDGSSYIFNVGDSRLYGFYDDLILLTEDHNLASDLMKAGEISEEEALSHPKRHLLTNALGIWDEMKIDINKIKNTYRYLLICSDGLHGYVPETAMMSVFLEDSDIKSKADTLVELSKQAGGYDNVSVILIKRGDDHES